MFLKNFMTGRMNLKVLLIALLFIALLIENGCDKGIEPVTDITGFSGRITFQGSWPDSIQRTFVVVFDSLLEKPDDFNLFNIKFISNQISSGLSYYDYDSRDSALIPIIAGSFAYIAVVQQKTPEISLNRQDWIVAGVYYTNGDTTHPGRLVIPQNSFVRNINIICDFDNPPPQPPGG